MRQFWKELCGGFPGNSALKCYPFLGSLVARTDACYRISVPRYFPPKPCFLDVFYAFSFSYICSKSIAFLMEKIIHQGRNIKRFREILGIKQEALVFELG